MNEDFCRFLKESIDDESKATATYGEMSRQVRVSERPDLSIAFLNMSKDEARHKETLQKIHDAVCETGE